MGVYRRRSSFEKNVLAALIFKLENYTQQENVL